MKRTFDAEMANRAEVLNKILLERSEDITVTYRTGWKNNEELETYVLSSPKFNCSPTVTRDSSWFDKSDEEVVDYIINIYYNNSLSIDVDRFLNKEFILDNILPRVASNDNIENMMVEDIAFVTLLDMVTYFYVPLDDTKVGEGFHSLCVKQGHLDLLGISVDEAYNASIKNMRKVVVKMNFLEKLFGDLDSIPEELALDYPPFTILTNKWEINGAAAMLCKDVLADIAEEYGERIMIIPSSIHECIVVPFTDDISVDFLYAMVKEVNNTEVADKDKLTYSIYEFADNELKIAV